MARTSSGPRSSSNFPQWPEVNSLRAQKNIAKNNAKLNQYTGKHKIIVGDAFDELNNLAKAKQKFDIVVIDPPSFAPGRNMVNSDLM